MPLLLAASLFLPPVELDHFLPSPGFLDWPPLLLGILLGLLLFPIFDLLFLARWLLATYLRERGVMGLPGRESSSASAVSTLCNRFGCASLSACPAWRLALLHARLLRVPLARGWSHRLLLPTLLCRQAVPRGRTQFLFLSPRAGLLVALLWPRSEASSCAGPSGQLLRDSGRHRLHLRSRLYLAFADFEGQPFDPPRVFHSFAPAAALCKRGSFLGDSILIGVPSGKLKNC